MGDPVFHANKHQLKRALLCSDSFEFNACARLMHARLAQLEAAVKIPLTDTTKLESATVSPLIRHNSISDLIRVCAAFKKTEIHINTVYSIDMCLNFISLFILPNNLAKADL